jgi:hypothetical protein
MKRIMFSPVPGAPHLRVISLQIMLCMFLCILLCWYDCLSQCRHPHTDHCYVKWAITLTASCVEENACGQHNNCNEFGNAYVEFEMCLIIHAAAGTMTAFWPGILHATTYSHRISQCGASMTLSTHILNAYKKAKSSGGFHQEDKEGVASADDH